MAETVKMEGIVGGPAAILSALEERLKTTRMSSDVAVVEAASIAKRKAFEYFYNFIKPQIQDVYDFFVIDRGEWNPDERLYWREMYSDDLDAAIERLMDQYKHIVTMNFIGAKTVDTRLWEENAIHNLADGFAVDAVKVLTWHIDDDEGKPKTNAQILSAAGIVREDIDTLLGNTLPTKAEMEQNVMNNLSDVAARIHEYIGMMGMSGTELQMHVDNASDTDAGLAQSGMGQIGGEWPGDWNALKDARKQWGVEGLVNYLEQYDGEAEAAEPEETAEDDMAEFMGAAEAVETPPQVMELPPLPDGSKPRTVKPKGRRSSKDESKGLPSEILTILKENTGVDASTLGAAIGVTRQTFENYAKGKGVLVPEAKHIASIRNVLDDKRAKLQKASDLLDEYEMINSQ